MKKLLMALVLSLAVSASCFAAGASGRFAAEEKTADALVAALTGNGGNYEQVSKSFSKGLKEKLTAEQFAAVQAGIQKQVGAIKNPNFVLLNKQFDLQKGPRAPRRLSARTRQATRRRSSCAATFA